MRKFIAIVEWRDGDVEDADEITVWAENALVAGRQAADQWRETNGAAWPSACIARVAVLTPTQFRRMLASS